MDLNLLEGIIIRYFNITREHAPLLQGSLSSKSRKSKYVEARRVFVVVCRAKYFMTYQSIAKYLNRNHSTIMRTFNSSINLSVGDIFFKNLEEIMQILGKINHCG